MRREAFLLLLLGCTPRSHEEAFTTSEGQRLYAQMNCSGCHANGGGGMGPALRDAKWVYGHEPPQIFASIMDGRPNGMPAFRARLTDEQAWQLTTYVRSLGLPSNTAPKRNDHMTVRTP